VTLLGAKHLLPGESGFARLKLDRPVVLFPGDRFIIRQYSPVITMGGGRVLDAGEPPIRVERRDQLPFLQAIANATPGEALLARVNRRWIFGLSISDAVAETGWLPSRVQQLAAELKQASLITIFGGVLITNPWLDGVRQDVLTLVGWFHDENPLQPGMKRQQLRERTLGPDELFDGVMASLLREKKLEADGELLRLPGRGVVLRDEEAESKAQIEQAFAGAGLKVPLLKDVLASLPVDKVRAQKIVTLLLRDRVLVKLSDDLVFHRDALDGLRRQVVANKIKTPKLSVPQFKDLFDITRKYAIPLLEYLDRERVTRRVGDERVIL
jgi:selenocysteine-specific elongation factor